MILTAGMRNDSFFLANGMRKDSCFHVYPSSHLGLSLSYNIR